MCTVPVDRCSKANMDAPLLLLLIAATIAANAIMGSVAETNSLVSTRPRNCSACVEREIYKQMTKDSIKVGLAFLRPSHPPCGPAVSLVMPACVCITNSVEITSRSDSCKNRMWIMRNMSRRVVSSFLPTVQSWAFGGFAVLQCSSKSYFQGQFHYKNNLLFSQAY